MGNSTSSPLQQCLSSVFSSNPAGVAFPDNPLYQVQYVLPYNLDIPVTPAAVTRPTDSAQIADVIQCASNSGVKVQPRSGGHSYGNYGLGGESGAVVVDLVNFQQFEMDRSTWRASIGSGTLLDGVTQQLHDNGNRAIAHGTCPQVGIGGHATIGGLGPISRMWGTALDHVEEVEVVLANGTVTHASDTENADLFWSLKGAGASFGIITEVRRFAYNPVLKYLTPATTFPKNEDFYANTRQFKFRTHPEPSQSVQYTYSFTGDGYEDMASVFEAWQDLITGPNLSRKFASQVMISEIGMVISGTFFGSQTEYDRLGLESRFPKAPASKSIIMTSWLGAVAHWAEDVLQEAGGGVAAPFYAKSLAFTNDTLLTSKTIQDLFQYIEQADKGTFAYFIIFDLEAGATNDVAQAATAYAHRDALFYLQSYAVGIPNVSSTTKKFLTDINALVEKSMPGADLGAYPGYVDPALPDGKAQEEYWGSNYPRLQVIKSKYDPGDLFHNPQSVRPA